MAMVKKTLEEIRQLSEQRKWLPPGDDDENIDYSEMPPLTEAEWRRALTYEQFLQKRRETRKKP